MSTAPPTQPRPQRGDELELTIDSLAFGGAGRRARTDGYVVFVAGAVPGDRVRAVIGKRKRAYAEARAVEIARAQPRPDRAGGRPSGRAVAGAALRAPARGQAGAGRRRAAAHRQARRLRAGADRPRGGSSGATATSSSTRSAPTPPAGWCAASTPRAAGTRSCALDDCLLASERANAAREQIVAVVPRAGPDAPMTAAAARAFCATSSCARAGARARSRCGWYQRRASSTATR